MVVLFLSREVIPMEFSTTVIMAHVADFMQGGRDRDTFWGTGKVTGTVLRGAQAMTVNPRNYGYGYGVLRCIREVRSTEEWNDILQVLVPGSQALLGPGFRSCLRDACGEDGWGMCPWRWRPCRSRV